MLPEKLSTELTSLNEGEDRVGDGRRDGLRAATGALRPSDVYGAAVHNKAKLAYDSVSVGLEGRPVLAGEGGVDRRVCRSSSSRRTRVAQTLRELRHEQGALDLETIEPRAIFEDDTIVDLRRPAAEPGARS